MNPSRKVLLLLPEVPWPPVTGGKRAHLSTIHSLLAARCDLKIVACNIDSTPEQLVDFSRQPIAKITEVIFTNSPQLQGSKLARMFAFVAGALSMYPSQYAFTYRSGARRRVAMLIDNERFDVVWADHLYALAMMPERISTRVILSTQNIETHLIRSVIAQASSFMQKAKRCWDYIRVCRLERELLSRADDIVCLSSADADYIQQSYTLPVSGCLLPLSNPPRQLWRPPLSPSISFVGSYGFAPNQDAIDWIIERLSHPLWSINANIKINIIGGGKIPSELRARAAKNVIFHGMLPDQVFHQILNNSSAVISPIIIGSGIKMKVLDAALAGVPVISTRFSLIGLPHIYPALLIEDRESALVAESVAAVINDLTRLGESSAKTHVQLDKAFRQNNEILQRLLSNCAM